MILAILLARKFSFHLLLPTHLHTTATDYSFQEFVHSKILEGGASASKAPPSPHPPKFTHAA